MRASVKQVIIVPKEKFHKSPTTERLALFNEDGSPIGQTSDTGETLLLTGYESQKTGNVSASDNANKAFTKLETRIIELETRIIELETIAKTKSKS